MQLSGSFSSAELLLHCLLDVVDDSWCLTWPVELFHVHPLVTAVNPSAAASANKISSALYENQMRRMLDTARRTVRARLDGEVFPALPQLTRALSNIYPSLSQSDQHRILHTLWSRARFLQHAWISHSTNYRFDPDRGLVECMNWTGAFGMSLLVSASQRHDHRVSSDIWIRLMQLDQQRHNSSSGSNISSTVGAQAAARSLTEPGLGLDRKDLMRFHLGYVNL